MLLENLVTRRVSEENTSNSSLTRRVTKQGHLLLAVLDCEGFFQSRCNQSGHVAAFETSVDPDDGGFIRFNFDGYRCTTV